MREKGLRNYIINQIFTVILAITIALGLCYIPGTQTIVKAATDTAFEQSISGFPNNYKSYLRNLHAKFPNWKFVPYNTGINFNIAVAAEASKDRSLVENSYSNFFKSNAVGDYNASTGKYIAKDGSSWVTASKNAVAYFMDPRNFLNENHIYMFEQLAYDSASQTLAGVEAILDGSFMDNKKISYTYASNKTATITYAKVIMDVASRTHVSAYYIASKILQEIGKTASGSVTGKYSGYVGYYNYYNIGATSGSNPIANGLKWAKSGTTYRRPWNAPWKSILGGAEYIGAKYINLGQNTTYFQRFNVRSGGTYPIYTHQYMTNISGCASEAATTGTAYESLGIKRTSKTFLIPVYKSMPEQNTTVKLGSTGNKYGKINSSVNLRKGPSTSDSIVTTLNKNDNVTIMNGEMTGIQYSSRLLSNPYWYKLSVVKNGKTYTGYVSAGYVNVNSEKSVMVGVSTNLGTTRSSGSEIIYYMSENPAIATVDESGNVKGLKNGTVTIYAFTAGGSMSPCTVTVYTKGCILNKTAITLNKGKTKKLKATVYPTNATAAQKVVTWKSSNTKVATVSSTGKIKAKEVGTATISASAAVGGVVSKCKVTVVIPVSSVKLNRTKKKLTVGSTTKLKATVLPADATNKAVTWKSSKKSVAKVSKSGKVTAKSAGTAEITAITKNGNKVAKCTITVRPKQLSVAKAVSSGYNSAKLTWTSLPKITGYFVYRKNSSGKYIKVGAVGSNVISYIDKKLVTGKTYSYKVRAYRVVSGKNYYGKLSKPVTAKPIPGKAKIRSIKATGKKKAVITWKKVNGATGYRLYRKTPSSKYKVIKTSKSVNVLTYTDKKLTTGVTYSYKMRVYRKVSGKKIYGKYSKVVSFTK